MKRNLSKNLIRLRREKRYSQSEVSDVLGISQPSYNRIESGKSNIHILHLRRLAKFYDIMMDDFFKSEDELNKDLNRPARGGDELNEKIKTLVLLNEIINKRNRELEEKIDRRNRKIETLMKRRNDS